MTRLPDPPDEPEEATVELSWPDISRPTIGYQQPQQGVDDAAMEPEVIDRRPPDDFDRATSPTPPPLDLGLPPRRVPAWPFVVIAVLAGLIVVAVVVLWLV